MKNTSPITVTSVAYVDFEYITTLREWIKLFRPCINRYSIDIYENDINLELVKVLIKLTRQPNDIKQEIDNTYNYIVTSDTTLEQKVCSLNEMSIDLTYQLQ